MTATSIAISPGRPRVTFIWHGLPAYGAALLRGALEADEAAICIVATRPEFSTDPIDRLLPDVVHWHEASARISWADVPGGLPDLAVVTGWGFPFCQRLAREAAAAGKPVVTMSDNRWRGDLRQRCGKFVYRLRYARLFSGGWVPGASAGRLLREFGVAPDRIFPRLYGCDRRIFRSDTPLASRSKRIVFVGQMIHRKGVDVLLEAFERSGLAGAGWQLEMFGSGPLGRLAAGRAGVRHVEFSPPEVVARAVGAARICVMPSRDDNWPLALHEGASAGCLLLTTSAVGSSSELVGPANGLVVSPGDPAALSDALLKLAAFDEVQLARAEAASLERAGLFGPAAFADSLRDICTTLLPAEVFGK